MTFSTHEASGLNRVGWKFSNLNAKDCLVGEHSNTRAGQHPQQMCRVMDLLHWIERRQTRRNPIGRPWMSIQTAGLETGLKHYQKCLCLKRWVCSWAVAQTIHHSMAQILVYFEWTWTHNWMSQWWQWKVLPLSLTFCCILDADPVSSSASWRLMSIWLLITPEPIRSYWRLPSWLKADTANTQKY